MPDFIFVVAASVVSLSVLIPFIVEKDSRGPEAVRVFISNIFSFFAILVATASLLAFLFMPAISEFSFRRLYRGGARKSCLCVTPHVAIADNPRLLKSLGLH